RPNLCPPWDDDIRDALGRGTTRLDYREHMLRARTELAEAVADLGEDGSAEQLPGLVGRPNSSPVKLVDEHDWSRYSNGCLPPSPEQLQQWAIWGEMGR